MLLKKTLKRVLYVETIIRTDECVFAIMPNPLNKIRQASVSTGVRHHDRQHSCQRRHPEGHLATMILSARFICPPPFSYPPNQRQNPALSIIQLKRKTAVHRWTYSCQKKTKTQTGSRCDHTGVFRGLKTAFSDARFLNPP